MPDIIKQLALDTGLWCYQDGELWRLGDEGRFCRVLGGGYSIEQAAVLSAQCCPQHTPSRAE